LPSAPDGKGGSVATLTAEHKHMNPHGVVHGAVDLCTGRYRHGCRALPDAGGRAGLCTIEIKISYFRPVSGGEIHCATQIDNKGRSYDASAIEVLEGLEPVRRAPACISAAPTSARCTISPPKCSTTAMDEAVAGHANRIEMTLGTGNRLTITDNGRGIPVDPHPKFPGKSALEVIMTTLHSGGKFEGKAYATSGGLHGVGVSVVNALSTDTVVEVARNKQLYRQRFARGMRRAGLKARPDAQPARHHHRLRARSRNFRRRCEVQARAAVQAGAVESLSVCRRRNPLEMRPGLASEDVPQEAVFQFPGGLPII
jgi:topoisomerase-4 subunit B